MSVSPTRSEIQTKESSQAKLVNGELKSFIKKTHGVINDETFGQIAEQFPKATKLKLPGSKVSASALGSLRKMADLTSVIFGTDDKITPLEEVSLCKFFEDHPHLETVDLTGIGGLTGPTLLALCNNCKKTNDLEINAESLTTEDLESLRKLEKLDTLMLKNAEKLGDEAIISLLESKKLVNLTLSGCKTSATVFDQLAVQEQMRVFSIDGLSSLTESDLDSIKRVFPNLQSLFLGGCSEEIKEKITAKFADYPGAVEIF